MRRFYEFHVLLARRLKYRHIFGVGQACLGVAILLKPVGTIMLIETSLGITAEVYVAWCVSFGCALLMFYRAGAFFRALLVLPMVLYFGYAARAAYVIPTTPYAAAVIYTMLFLIVCLWIGRGTDD